MGSYSVTITDELCGTAVLNFSLLCECSSDCSIYGEIRDASCTVTGRIEVEIECELGGHCHSPWTYQWQDGPTSKSRTNLDPGNYCLTATDNDGCSYDRCFTVEGNDILRVVVVEKDNVSKCGDVGGEVCAGSIDIEVVSGSGGYMYQWSNGQSSQDVSDLCEGDYSVTVTDEKGCEEVLTVSICCCLELEWDGRDIYKQPGNCYRNDGADGSADRPKIDGQAYSDYYYPYIQTEVTGGTGDYACSWTGPNGFTAYDCWGLGGPLDYGTYCLTVDDGCRATQECFDIVDCSLLNIVIEGNVTNTCTGFNAGSISVEVNGGVSPYSYAWNNGASSSSIDMLSSGSYTVTVTDNNGCIATPQSFNVGTNAPQVINSTNPCQRRTICNGEERIENFELEFVSLNCNILTERCPATGNLIVTDLGFVDVFIQNCTVIGICQSGQQVILEQGQTVFGPFGVSDVAGCNPFGIGCADFACFLPESGQTIIEEGTPITCSSAFFDPFGCGEDECFVQVVCGSTVVAEGCVPPSESCIPAFAPEAENLAKLDLAKELGISSVKQPSKSELVNIYNEIYSGGKTIEFIQNEVELTNHKAENSFQSIENQKELNVSVFPNPFDGQITLDVESTENYLVEVSISNAIGGRVLNRTIALHKGSNSVNFNMFEFPPGLYFLNILKDGKVVSASKMLKN